jgi:hypothetical protein
MFNIFGSDKKTSQTTNTTTYQHTDRSASAGAAGALAASDGAQINIQTSDPKLVAKMLETTRDTSLATLSFGAAINQGALDFASEANKQAQRDKEVTAQQTTGTVERLGTLYAQNLAENKADPTNQTVERIAKYGAIAAAVLVLGSIILFSRKSP